MSWYQLRVCLVLWWQKLIMNGLIT